MLMLLLLAFLLLVALLAVVDDRLSRLVGAHPKVTFNRFRAGTAQGKGRDFYWLRLHRAGASIGWRLKGAPKIGRKLVILTCSASSRF